MTARCHPHTMFIISLTLLSRRYHLSHLLHLKSLRTTLWCPYYYDGWMSILQGVDSGRMEGELYLTLGGEGSWAKDTVTNAAVVTIFGLVLMEGKKAKDHQGPPWLHYEWCGAWSNFWVQMFITHTVLQHTGQCPLTALFNPQSNPTGTGTTTSPSIEETNWGKRNVK